MCACRHAHARAHMWMCVCAGMHMPRIPCGRQETTLGSWYSPATSWDLGIELRSSGLCASAPACWTIPPQDLLREISAGVWRWQVPGSLVFCTLSLYLPEAHRQSVSWGLYTRNSLIMRRASFHNWGIRVSLSPLTPIRKEAISQGGAPWRSLQHSLAMLSLADQGNVYSPQANISTNNLFYRDKIFWS